MKITTAMWICSVLVALQFTGNSYTCLRFFNFMSLTQFEVVVSFGRTAVNGKKKTMWVIYTGKTDHNN